MYSKDKSLLACEKWYEHHSEPVTEDHKVIILWHFTILIGRHIKANRPLWLKTTNKRFAFS